MKNTKDDIKVLLETICEMGEYTEISDIDVVLEKRLIKIIATTIDF